MPGARSKRKIGMPAFDFDMEPGLIRRFIRESMNGTEEGKNHSKNQKIRENRFNFLIELFNNIFLSNQFLEIFYLIKKTK